MEESFDRTYHLDFFRARFDYNPYTGEKVHTTLDSDNFYETSKSASIVEDDMVLQSDFTIIEKIDGSSITTIQETLHTSPVYDAWDCRDFDGSKINSGHFLDNPEEIVLWSTIKIPQDWSKWEQSSPFGIKMRATDPSNVKVIISVFDSIKGKVAEKVLGYDETPSNTLTNSWYLFDLTPSSGTWTQGSEFNVKIEVFLKTPESSLDISGMDLTYDTRYHTTTLSPLINYGSTATSINDTETLSSFNESVRIHGSNLTWTTTNDYSDPNHQHHQ